MKKISGTRLDIFLTAAVFAATIVALSWPLRAYLEMSWGKTLLILSPVIVIGAFSIIYGYGMRWKRDSLKARHPSRRPAFRFFLRLFLLSLVILIPPFMAVYFIFRGDLVLGAVIAFASSATSLWGARRVRKEMSREEN